MYFPAEWSKEKLKWESKKKLITAEYFSQCVTVLTAHLSISQILKIEFKETVQLPRIWNSHDVKWTLCLEYAASTWAGSTVLELWGNNRNTPQVWLSGTVSRSVLKKCCRAQTAPLRGFTARACTRREDLSLVRPDWGLETLGLEMDWLLPPFLLLTLSAPAQARPGLPGVGGPELCLWDQSPAPRWDSCSGLFPSHFL